MAKLQWVVELPFVAWPHEFALPYGEHAMNRKQRRDHTKPVEQEEFPIHETPPPCLPDIRGRLL